MSPEQRLDELVREIRRVDGDVEPIALMELGRRSPEAAHLNGSAPSADGVEIEWLVEVGGGSPVEASRLRLASVVAGIAAVVVLVAVLGAVILSDEGDDLPGSSTDSAGEPAGEAVEESPASRSSIEIVEGRYEAMNALDFEALHADVADDAVYCFLFLPRLEIEGCQDGTTGYHDVGGLGDQDEIAALLAHAYGGAIAYDCSVDDSTVTCTEQVRHLLADLAGVELHLLTVTFQVSEGQVVAIDKVPDGPEGVASSAVGSQETSYVAWLRERHPAEFDDLAFSGRPRISSETVPRHRQLVAEWIESIE